MGNSPRLWTARIGFVSLLVLAALAASQPSPREQPGPLPDGAYLLNSGWRVHPAGKQIPLDTLPMSTALSADGKYLVVLNGGYKPPSLSVIETASARVVSSVAVPDAWLGIAFAPKSNRLYVGGGSRAAVYEFTLTNGTLTAGRTFPVVPPDKRTAQDFIGDLAFSPDGRLIYAADLYRDSVVVINPQSGMVIARYKTGRRPYRILFHPDGKTFFVSHWADGSVGHYDANNGGQLAVVRIGGHPTDMLWRPGAPANPEEGKPAVVARLFVTASNTNNVYAVGVTEGKDLRLVESISVALAPRQPLGATPSALALSPDGKRLYVACSDANAVAVVNLAEDFTTVEGFIPAGWYPTAVRALGSGALVVLNGKGTRSYPNPQGPNPLRSSEPVREGNPVPNFTGTLQTGSASWIDPFTEEQLAAWTSEAAANSPYRDARLDDANPLPAIQHVIYIVKEGRTYDQVLGDVKQGNGDASLAVFGERVTPNQHKLAQDFVLFDNFYTNGDVSADGHLWSTAAIAPDSVQKLWPNHYARRRALDDFEEQDPASLPPAGYLWTNAAAAGLSIRNYGHMVVNRSDVPIPAPAGTEQVAAVRDPVLAKFTNRQFRGFDLSFADVDRARVFLADLESWERTGDMPRLITMRLGNDRTYGAAAGRLSPLSLAADNDYALGLIVEAVSKSRFWGSTAIFVLEAGAQNGADHVDSHRSPAFVISPWVRRRAVDGTMYNTTSMLRTMEFLLGLHPMTHYDAGARPMTAAFQKTPDAAPYTAERPRVSLTDVNPGGAPGAAALLRTGFDGPDRVN